ncbi:MAG: 3-isopropylmalate dehydratase [Desulfobacteraceae bacterium]|nr:MAG: 3-isopropylmalate dehydratase [Desulfobacteraceae bacterium]
MTGIAHKFGDDINTDYIISSSRKRDTVDPQKLARFLMEDIRPGFGLQVKKGDFLVAGKNFGCGSAMEIAPLVIVFAGVKAVIAKSYARSFYRNAINLGLLIVEADTDPIDEGDLLELENLCIIHDLTTGEMIKAKPFPPLIKEILDAGGIISYLERKYPMPPV